MSDRKAVRIERQGWLESKGIRKSAFFYMKKSDGWDWDRALAGKVTQDETYEALVKAWGVKQAHAAKSGKPVPPMGDKPFWYPPMYYWPRPQDGSPPPIETAEPIEAVVIEEPIVESVAQEVIEEPAQTVTEEVSREAEIRKVEGGWTIVVRTTEQNTGPFKPFYRFDGEWSRCYQTYGYRRVAQAAADRYNALVEEYSC